MKRLHGRKAYAYLYYTAAWKKLRAAQLLKQPLCEYCLLVGRVTVATVANHDPPHKGDADAFFDPDRLKSACKTCHDGRIQSYESTGRMRGSNADGTPIDPNHHWNKAS